MLKDKTNARDGDGVKRRLLIAAVFLLAGTVVNVAVASRTCVVSAGFPWFHDYADAAYPRPRPPDMMPRHKHC